MTKSPASPRKRTPESLRSHRWLGVEDLRAFVRTQLSGYKTPKHLVLVDEVRRAPNGKPDYDWAKAALADKPGQP